METEDSVYDLITSLCHILWTEYNTKPMNNLNIQTCRNVAFEILLKKAVDTNNNIDPIKELSYHQFEMKFESKVWSEKKKCEEFEILLENIKENDYFHKDLGRSILTFLVCLKNTSNEFETKDSKSSLFPFSWMNCGSMFGFFNDSSHKHKNNPYMLSTTRVSMFEQDKTIFDNKSSIINSDSPTSSFFSLQHDNVPITSYIPPTFNYQMNQKENIGTNFHNQSGSSQELENEKEQIIIYNWENLGQPTIRKENYLTPELDSLLHISAINGNLQKIPFIAKIVTIENFLRDLKSLTVGIRSESFNYDETFLFKIVPNLTIPNITPKSLEDSIKELIECGTCFKRLQTMTEKNCYNFKHIYDGFVFKALCTSVNKFLIMFQRFVMSFHDKTILQFSTRIRNLSKQLISLTKILDIHPDISLTTTAPAATTITTLKYEKKLPIGSDFLSYLYKEIIDVTKKDLSMLYIFILRQCCLIYFKNFHKWLFNGILDDQSKELFIYNVDNYRINTKTYFDKAYLIKYQSVPGFLIGYENDILLCGKYTMLLKQFKPQHPLFNIKQPIINVCLSYRQIQNLENQCNNYLRECYNICGKPITVEEIYNNRNEKHTRFLEGVKIKYNENLMKWRQEQIVNIEKINAQKRLQLIELQKQISDIQEQKLAEKKANIILEKMYIQNGLDAEKRQLEKENYEKQKRIKFYEELNQILEETKINAMNCKTNLDIKKEKIVVKDLTNSIVEQAQQQQQTIVIVDKHNDDDIMMMSQGSEISSSINIDDDTKLNVKIPLNLTTIKKSSSDYFNANDEPEQQSQPKPIQTELNRNKEKILGSKLGEFFEKITTTTTKTMDKKRRENDLANSPSAEAKRNKIKVLTEEFHSYINCDNEPNLKNVKQENLIDKNSNLTEMEIQMDQREVLLEEAGYNIVHEMSDLEKNKHKIMSSDFDFVDDDDDIPIIKIDKIKKELTELERNRIKVMSQEFNILSEEIPIKQKLNLNLDLERVRNKRKILECEYNIITGESTTPMSTGSDTPMIDDDDEKNGNLPISQIQQTDLRLITSLIIPKEFGIPDTALLSNDTPESALNTAGLLKKDGFNFPDKMDTIDTDFPANIDIPILDDKFQNFYETIKRKQSNFFPLQMNTNKNNHYNDNKIDANNDDDDDNNTDIRLTENELKNINVTTLTKFLQMSLVIPLNTHLEIINNEILKMFLQDLEILEHYKSLRNYYFLMDGEFGSNICDGIIKRLENGSTPIELMNFQTLNIILESALGNTINNNDKNSDKLSFTVNQIPDNFDLTQPNVLSNLTLNYRIQWPLNLLLNNETLEQYSNVFRYLLKVRRITWVLEESFQLLKISLKKNGQTLRLSPQYTYVQKIRHKLSHFVMTLQNHITSNALQSTWKLFKDDLKTTKTMDDLYKKHTNYIKRVLFLCMLNKKSIEFYNTIEDIFKVVLRFCRHLKSRDWRKQKKDLNYTHTKFYKMQTDERDFEKLITFTIYLGNKIVRHGYQTEIGEFINLININNYYDNKN